LFVCIVHRSVLRPAENLLARSSRPLHQPATQNKQHTTPLHSHTYTHTQQHTRHATADAQQLSRRAAIIAHLNNPSFLSTSTLALARLRLSCLRLHDSEPYFTFLPSHSRHRHGAFNRHLALARSSHAMGEPARRAEVPMRAESLEDLIGSVSLTGEPEARQARAPQLSFSLR
jgi:hypothetical protein